MTYRIRDTPLLIQTTSTGQSIICESCDWVEQLAPDTPVTGAVIISEKHYANFHSDN